MANLVILKKTNLKDQFIKRLKAALYDKRDFTQGEYIEAIDNVREIFQKEPDINHEELNEIVKSLTYDWKSIGESVRTDNQTYKTQKKIVIIALITALVTGIITWLIFRNKK